MEETSQPLPPNVPEVPVAPIPTRHKTSYGLIVAILVIAIIVVCAFAFVRFGGISLFQKELMPEEVIGNMLDSIPDIASAHYSVEGSFKAEPREAGAQPLVVDLPELAGQKQAIVRDRERLTELSSIVSSLETQKIQKKPYPLSLATLMGDTERIKDPATHQQYGYRQDRGGTGFTLHVQLETDAAARAYTKALDDEYKHLGKTDTSHEVAKLIETHETTPRVYASVDFSDASPYPLGAGFDELYQYLPTEIDANLVVSGDSQSSAEKLNDSAFNASGKVSIGSISFSGGLDILKKADEFFVRVNEAPSLGFFDLAAVKGKWIKAVPEDTYGTFLGDVLYKGGDDTSIDKQSAKVLKQYQLIFRILKEENLIQVVQAFPKETVNGQQLYHYVIKLDRNKFPEFYKRLTEETKKEFGEDAIFTFNEQTLTYLQSTEFGKLYDALEKNIRLELWVDTSSFQPRKISYSQRLVPPETILKLKDKQYRFGIVVGLSNVNEPVNVQVPSPTISIDEARMLLTGETIEQIKYERQVAQVEAIRDAISMYYRYTKKDPMSLHELLQKINDVPAASTEKELGGLESYGLSALKEKNKPFLTVIPKDIYTGVDYQYTSDGKSYQLKYEIKLPPKKEDDLSSYDYDYIRSQYVEGINTATEKVMSAEAEAANKENP